MGSEWKLVRGLDHKLVGNWQRVRRRCAGLFGNPGWLVSWAKFFSQEPLLWIRSKDNLYIPMHIKTTWGMKRLVSLGDYPCLYDEMSWCVSKKAISSLIGSMMDEPWQVMELHYWSDRDQIDAISRMADSFGLSFQVREEEGIPWIDLGKGTEPASDRLRKDLKSDLKRLEKEVGKVRVVKASRQEWPGFLETYQRAWKRLGTKPLLVRSDNIASLLRELDDEHIAFHKLLAGDKVIAWHFGYKDKEEFVYEFPTYNPDYAKYSPGRIMLWFLVKEAKDEGHKRFSLGRGVEPYKLRWTKEIKPLFSISLYRNRYLAKLDPMRARESLASFYRHLTSRKT